MSGSGLTIVGVEPDGAGLRIEFHVDAESRWFAGHFPGEPILPAIAHFDLLSRAHRAAGGHGRLAGLDGVRFARPVGPGDRLRLTLDPASGRESRFVVQTAAGEAVSSGLVSWADGGEGAGG